MPQPKKPRGLTIRRPDRRSIAAMGIPPLPASEGKPLAASNSPARRWLLLGQIMLWLPAMHIAAIIGASRQLDALRGF
jgi:hypothetical protein